MTCTLQHQGAGRDGIAQRDTVRVFACRGGAWATGGAVGIYTCAVTHTRFSRAETNYLRQSCMYYHP